jgi:hypothetical protein
MKGIDLLDEVLAALGRWVVVPNGMKTGCNIGQVHGCGLLVGSFVIEAAFSPKIGRSPVKHPCSPSRIGLLKIAATRQRWAETIFDSAGFRALNSDRRAP